MVDLCGRTTVSKGWGKKKEKKAEAMVDLRGRCETEGRGKQNPMNCIKRTNIQHFV
jgi:hypothetical protein